MDQYTVDYMYVHCIRCMFVAWGGREGGEQIVVKHLLFCDPSPNVVLLLIACCASLLVQ